MTLTMRNSLLVIGSMTTTCKAKAMHCWASFDAMAPAASAALGELAQGNLDKFHAILGPTVPLSHHIFRAPTRFYKTGVAFMAWLNDHQSLTPITDLLNNRGTMGDGVIDIPRIRGWMEAEGYAGFSEV